MSQDQAVSALPPVKRMKQTALTWKVKDKETSLLARRVARKSVKTCRQWRKSWGTEGDCPFQSFYCGDSSVEINNIPKCTPF